MGKQRLLSRRLFRLVFALALLAGVMSVGSAAAQEDGGDSSVALPGTPVAVTFTTVEQVDPGREFVDENGNFHFRDEVETDDVTGDIEGTATVTLDGDFIATGECTEESCEGSFSLAVQIDITSDSGGWTGYGGLISTSDGTYDSVRIVLVGNGGNTGQVIVLNEVTEETDAGISFSGSLIEQGLLPASGINVSYDLCFNSFTDTGGTAGGGFIMHGPVEASGSAAASFSGVGDESGVVFGQITFTAHDASGLEIGVMEGMFNNRTGQGGVANQDYGTFVVTGGTGVFEGMVGYGKTLETVNFEPTGSSCSGVQGQWIGSTPIS